MKLEVYTQILSKIIKFDKITLFIHERPDFDTLGSAFAVKAFINEYFPKKTAYVVGTYELNEKYGAVLFPFEKVPLDEMFLSESLAILFDVANDERVLTRKHHLAKEVIRIDHHIKIEEIGSIEWIDPIYPSTAEMVAWMIYELGYKITASMAKFLYAGIVTDTGRFLYQSTLPSTFLIASMLLKTGFNRLEVHDAIYLRSLREHKLMSYVINRIKITPPGCAYAILPKNIHKRFNIHDAPLSMVHALNNIKGVHIWTTIYYDNFSRAWKGSLRSRYFPINQIASQFNGGGHKLASGFSLKRKRDFHKLLRVINEYLRSICSPEGVNS